MPVEPRGLAVQAVFIKKGGRGEMTKAPISLQDLRRRLYVKAKTEPTWCRRPFPSNGLNRLERVAG